MIIIFDMDEVLVDLMVEWVNEINRLWGTSVKLEDITEWDITKAFPTVTFENMSYILNRSDFWNKVKPREYAIEYLEKFNREHEIYIATAAHPKTIQAKLYKCLFKYFPFLKEDQIITITNKALLKCHWLIDDNPNNLRYSSAETILIDRPWNRSINNASSYKYRCNNLKEAYELIN